MTPSDYSLPGWEEGVGARTGLTWLVPWTVPSAQWGPLKSGPGAPGILEREREREDRRKLVVCEERVVTVEPNQEITAQAERVWPRWCLHWAFVQQNHTEAWLCTAAVLSRHMRPSGRG